MKTPSRLLDELFRDTMPDDLRDRLFAETLRAARRRLWRRRLAIGALPIAVLLVLLVPLLVLLAPHESAPGETMTRFKPSHFIVASSPLPESMIVRTQPNVVELIATQTAVVALVRTPAGDRLYQELSDGQLLALLAGRPAAIVRLPQDARQARLLILDPEDSRSLGLP
jgi:hypothetical protein